MIQRDTVSFILMKFCLKNISKNNYIKNFLIINVLNKNCNIKI